MPDNTQPSVQATMQRLDVSTDRRRLARWIAAACLIFVVGAFAAAGSLRGAVDSIRYQTQPVRVGDLAVTVTATGNLEATNQVEVGSELSGIITSITADYNDTVAASQPLAYLDDAKYKAAVMKSRAQVASAQADYREALATRSADEKTLQRYRRTRALTSGKLPSLEDLEQAEADLERATATVAAAAAAIEIARATLTSDETDLKKTVVYAPISGIVLGRDIEPGQTVAASLEAPVLFILAEDLHHMELQVDVDEADVGLVKKGQSAEFTVDAYPDRRFAAHITQVRYGAETTDGVVTYKTVLQVQNPDLLLRPGMTATATITVRKIENSLLVPNTALRFTPAPPAGGVKKGRGLLGSLMPGPPRRRQSKKNAGEAPPGPTGDQSCVWVLKDSHPAPVAVKKVATNGVLTAVTAPDLHEGTELILNALTTKG